MRRSGTLAPIAVALLIAAAPSGGQPPVPKTPPQRTPIAPQLDVVIPIAPTAFKADGRWHMVYELHLTNMNRSDCKIASVDAVADDASRRTLVSYAGTRLDSALARPGLTVTDKSVLAPGTEGIVFVWASVDNANDVPTAIRHRLVVTVGSNLPDTVITAPVRVGRGAVAITSPLTGDHWLAGNGPSFSSGHRRALVVIDGHAAIAQRFAIDWVRLHDNGKTFQGDSLDNKNYLAYGSNALAVADGIVVETKDSIPQNVPGENSRAVPITLETVAGNHIVLDIGNGHYALYAHLQPGSLRVKRGDHVRRAQVLGLVGNTGNSTEPHLHFHIMDGPSPLGSEGLPYALPSFQVVSHGWKQLQAGVSEAHHDEIPLEDEVVTFP
ncbi:MAG TPA: M23 family metallopeptidase [Gemmatimonadaceae bacterium]|nr:M23 family metallopeptidase [Gemmatimonadaceae bacterium]